MFGQEKRIWELVAPVFGSPLARPGFPGPAISNLFYLKIVFTICTLLA